MTINYNYFDGRYTQYLSTEVEKVATHKGHDIYQDKDEWYYVFCFDNWQYFGTLREAKRFINTTLWQ
jgi:hypothetical protein